MRNSLLMRNRFLLRLIRKTRRKIIRLLFREQWSILVCDHSGKFLREITPPPDRIWADPFPVCHDGRYYLFLEEQLLGGRGRLCCMELFDDLSTGTLIPVLDLSHHLSWPNVFPVREQGGTQWYMVPESNRAGVINCYRATSFPYEWDHAVTLMSDIRCADPEIYHDGNTWFLFVSVQDKTHGMNDSLFAFHSKTFPSDEWTPLPGNPVVTGREKSRMAGKIYRDSNGLLVRPAQYSKDDYGQRVVLNRINTLSSLEYHETVISTVYPEKNIKAVATHTWNPCGPYVFRDVKKRYFDPLWKFIHGKGTHS